MTPETVPAGTIRRDEMAGWIREVVSFGVRRPAWPADVRAERYMKDRFREFGLEDVILEPVPVIRWVPEVTGLSLGDSGADIPCSPLPYSAWTPRGGVTAPAVWVGDGSLENFAASDVSGRIAVAAMRFADLDLGPLRTAASTVYDPARTLPEGVLHKANWLMTNLGAYYLAQVHGAAAFVGVLSDYPIDGCAYYVPYDGWAKELPAVYAGRGSEKLLHEAAASGEVLTLTSSGRSATVESHNVVGRVPGSGDEALLVTCHHDAPFASAVEDASGLSVLLALAKAFGSSARRLERSIIFLAASGHFHGGIGCREFVSRHAKDLMPSIAAALGCEHIGHEAECDGRGGYRLTGRAEARAVFCADNEILAGLVAEGLKCHGIDRTLVLPPYLFGTEPPCDAAPFFTAGVPSASMISSPMYAFDDQDTLDKVREEDLAPVAEFFAELICRLDRVGAADLQAGVSRERGAEPPPLPSWFMEPGRIIAGLRKASEP